MRSHDGMCVCIPFAGIHVHVFSEILPTCTCKSSLVKCICSSVHCTMYVDIHCKCNSPTYCKSEWTR